MLPHATLSELRFPRLRGSGICPVRRAMPSTPGGRQRYTREDGTATIAALFEGSPLYYELDGDRHRAFA